MVVVVVAVVPKSDQSPGMPQPRISHDIVYFAIIDTLAWPNRRVDDLVGGAAFDVCFSAQSACYVCVRQVVLGLTVSGWVVCKLTFPD